jgi:hypothetical protein
VREFIVQHNLLEIDAIFVLASYGAFLIFELPESFTFEVRCEGFSLENTVWDGALETAKDRV